MPLLFLRLAGMQHPQHLRTRVATVIPTLPTRAQPKIQCRRQILGQAAVRLQTWPHGSVTGRQGLVRTLSLEQHSNARRPLAPTAPGSPSTPPHRLHHRGQAVDASTTSFNAYGNR